MLDGLGRYTVGCGSVKSIDRDFVSILNCLKFNLFISRSVG